MIPNFPHAPIAACFSSGAIIADSIFVLATLKAPCARLDCDELSLAQVIGGALLTYRDLTRLPFIVVSGQAKAREPRHV